MIVVLHNLRSLHNVGSIFRTADAAGAEKIYLCGITPEPMDRIGRFRPDLIKVSLGAEKYIQWEKTPSVSKLIDKLKKDGYKIFAVEQDKKSTPYYKVRGVREGSRVRIILVFGNEVKGLPKAILKKADKILEIPMRGKKESLNVAVAAGIILFHFLHKWQNL